LPAILVEAGTVTGDSTAMCAHIATNDVNNPDGGDIRVRNVQAATTFRLPTYSTAPGASTDMTAVADFLKSHNAITDAAAFKGASNTAGFGGGNPTTCPAP
jgi:hypothetical protein